MIRIIEKSILFLLFILSFSIVLALTGLFDIKIILTGAGLIILIFFVFRKKGGVLQKEIPEGKKKETKVNSKYSRIFILVILLSLLILIINVCFHHEMLWGERDYTVYTLSAINLSKTGSLWIKDSIVSTYLGFHASNDNTWLPQFLPGYIAYLAMFYSFGGLWALYFSNSILIFFSILLIFLIARTLKNNKCGLIASIIFITNYLIFWFPRRTLSENLSMFLILAAVYFFISGLIHKDQSKQLFSFFPILLNIIVRPEGIFFLISFIVAYALTYLSYFRRKKAVIINRKKLYGAGILNIINLIIIFLYAYLFKSQSLFYIRNIKKAIHTGIGLIKTYPDKLLAFFSHSNLSDVPNAITNSSNGDNVYFGEYLPQFLTQIFASYGLILLILMTVVALLIKEKRKEKILLTLLVAPSFMFLVNPSITIDQPWFMRHFWPTLIPYIIILSAFLLTYLLERGKNIRKLSLVIIIFIILINLNISIPIINYSEYQGLDQLLAKIAKDIEKNSIVISSFSAHNVAPSLYFRNNVPIVISYNAYLQKEPFCNLVIPLIQSTDKVYVLSSIKKEDGNDESQKVNEIIKNDSLVLSRSYNLDIYFLPKPLTELNSYIVYGLPLEGGYDRVIKLYKDIPPSNIKKWNKLFYLYRVDKNKSIEEIINNENCNNY